MNGKHSVRGPTLHWNPAVNNNVKKKKHRIGQPTLPWNPPVNNNVKKKKSKYQSMKVSMYEPTSKQILKRKLDRPNQPLSCAFCVFCVDEKRQVVVEEWPVGGVGIRFVCCGDYIETLSRVVFNGIVIRGILVPCRVEANHNNLRIGLLDSDIELDTAHAVKEKKGRFCSKAPVELWVQHGLEWVQNLGRPRR